MMPRVQWRRAGKRLSLWLPVLAVACLLYTSDAADELLV